MLQTPCTVYNDILDGRVQMDFNLSAYFIQWLMVDWYPVLKRICRPHLDFSILFRLRQMLGIYNR